MAKICLQPFIGDRKEAERYLELFDPLAKKFFPGEVPTTIDEAQILLQDYLAEEDVISFKIVEAGSNSFVGVIFGEKLTCIVIVAILIAEPCRRQGIASEAVKQFRMYCQTNEPDYEDFRFYIEKENIAGFKLIHHFPVIKDDLVNSEEYSCFQLSL